ncbi:MAG: tRNA epoxyqueuosine(34) reductase QueG [Anaerolineales bacterium]
MTTVTPQELKRKVVEKARSLGFDLVGVTTPDPPPHLEAYRNWIAADRHGEMGYLASERNLERRADPKKILPECQSIVVLGMNYLPGDATVAQAESQARVASYALGEDYHEVIPERLEDLVRAMEGWLGGEFPHRYYTDTGPILERELAQRAGLGWIGKNTCLINPQKGSYFFLAELFLGLELPSDEPLTTDHCGSCTRCLEACPTSCILPDRTLDARRCISYLTIELKDELPLDLRETMGDWVFGCDICQQVCPWNQRFARATREPAYQTREFFEQVQPASFLRLNQQQYQEAFKGSPLKRAKRHGLARNAAVAAANRADPSAIPSLRRTLLDDPHVLPRQHAAWALGQFDSSSAQAALEEAKHAETEARVLDEIESALDRRNSRVS